MSKANLTLVNGGKTDKKFKFGRIFAVTLYLSILIFIALKV